jgi:hypothetical protein
MDIQSALETPYRNALVPQLVDDLPMGAVYGKHEWLESDGTFTELSDQSFCPTHGVQIRYQMNNIHEA